jgi:aminoglycoside 6'-N-acetyltransferase I
VPFNATLMPTIRPPTIEDAASLARLVTELGYPSTEAELADRLEAFSCQPNAAMWVADDAGVVAGLATGHAIMSLHKTEPVAMLTVLVVAGNHRGKGIGTALLRHAEAWAIAQGATAISLTSALRRVDAHGFYKANGYDHTGVRLARVFGKRTP